MFHANQNKLASKKIFSAVTMAEFLGGVFHFVVVMEMLLLFTMILNSAIALLCHCALSILNQC